MTTNPRLAAADVSFTVLYPAAGTAYDVATDETGVAAEFPGDHGRTMRLSSEAAPGRPAQQITAELIDETFADPVTSYEIPTRWGYHPGYGEAADYLAAECQCQVMIALLVLLPETLAAVRSAHRGRIEVSLNLGLGSAMAGIGVDHSHDRHRIYLAAGPLALGLNPTQIVLLVITVAVGTLSLHRVASLSSQSGVRLVVFAGFVSSRSNPEWTRRTATDPTGRHADGTIPMDNRHYP